MVKKNFLKIVFSNETEFNAVAYLEDKTAVSNISIATVIDIYHHALILMKRNDFFGDLGKEETMNFPFEFWGFEYPEIVDLDNGYKQINFYEGPESDEKKSAAFLITCFGMEFLIFHEIGHHIGGHIGYIKDKLNMQELFAQGQIKIIDAKKYQLLEMDADALSIAMLLENIKIKLSYYSTFVNGNINLIPHLLVSAITIVFFLIKKDFVEDFSYNNKYLPRDFRFYLVLSILFSKLGNEYNICCQFQSKKSLLMTIGQTNKLLKELYIQEGTEQSIELHNLERIGRYYTETLLKEWKPLREELMEYAKVELPE